MFPLESEYPLNASRELNEQNRPLLDFIITEGNNRSFQLMKPGKKVLELYHAPYFAISADASPMDESGIIKIKNLVARGIPVITQFLLPSNWQNSNFYEYDGTSFLSGSC